MNIIFIIAFLGLLLALLSSLELLSSNTVLVSLSISLSLTLIPILISLYDYVVNPKNRFIRILDGICKVILADRYGPYKAKKLLQGEWLTCHYLCLNYSMYTHDKVYVLEKCLHSRVCEFQNLDRVYNCRHKNKFYMHQTFDEFIEMRHNQGSGSKFEFYAEVLGRDNSNNQLSFKFKYENGDLILSANYREYPEVVQILYKDEAEIGVYLSLRKMVDCLQIMPIIDLKSYLMGKRRRGVGVLHCKSLKEVSEVFMNNLDVKVYEMSIFENKWFIEDRNHKNMVDL